MTTKDEEQFIGADNVVLATGAKPDQELHHVPGSSASQMHLVGDCVESRNMRAAIADGWRIGGKI